MMPITCRPRWQPTDYLLEELHRYDAGIEMDLEDIDLTGRDLAGINLTGATLAGASLNGANLRGAILDRACLCNVDARRVDLSGASLRHTVIIDTDLEHATLTNVDAGGSILIRTRTEGGIPVGSLGRFPLARGLVRCERRPTTGTSTRSTPWA